MRKKHRQLSPAVSENKGCCRHQVLATAATLLDCAVRGFRMKNNRILKCTVKGMTSMSPDSYIFLYTEKC